MPDETEAARNDGLLRLRREVADRAVVIHAAGEVDHVTAPRLADELAKAGQETPGVPLVLDMTGISFIASAGLAVLVEHQHRGRELRIVAAGSAVARAIERTGLAQFLPVYTTMADALPDR